MSGMHRNDEFDISCRAFSLLTRDERKRALEKFSRLKHPSVTDRFFDAVHRVITEKPQAAKEVG